MSNPFADHAGKQSMEDLNANPFSDSHDKYLEPDDAETTPHASSVSLPYHQQAEQYRSTTGGRGGSAGGASAGDDTAARLEEIRRREAELAQREANLGAREDHIRRHGRNNWPPKPFWPFAPILFHDIDQEIPQESKVIVSTLYKIWLALMATLILNLVACILLLVSGADDGARDLGGSIVDLLVAPLAFLLWYRPAYNGYQKEVSFYYYLYFVFAAFHIAFVVYSLIGIPSTGSAGIINTISSFASGRIVTGVFCVLATVGWGIQSVGSVFMYRFVWKHHNDKGHTFAQAKQDLQMHGIKAYFSRSSSV